MLMAIAAILISLLSITFSCMNIHYARVIRRETDESMRLRRERADTR